MKIERESPAVTRPARAELRSAFAELLFWGMVGVSGWGVYIGVQGRFTAPEMGYKVPDAVRRSVDLSARANGMVARWCGAAAVLAVPPAGLFTLSAFGALTFELSLPWLVAVAVYGFVISVIGGHPIERVARM